MEANDPALGRNTRTMDSQADAAAPTAAPRRLPVAALVMVAAVAQLVLIRLVGSAISPLVLCGLGVVSVVILNGAVSPRAVPPPPAPPR